VSWASCAELAGAVAGSGRLALLNGAAGVGKTALAAVLCREAAGAGVAVLADHCYDGTETPALAG
jgi:DNA replication protein DnaC